MIVQPFLHVKNRTLPNMVMNDFKKRISFHIRFILEVQTNSTE